MLLDLLAFELAHVETVVEAFLLEQAGVAAAFDDFAAFEIILAWMGSFYFIKNNLH